MQLRSASWSMVLWICKSSFQNALNRWMTGWLGGWLGGWLCDCLSDWLAKQWLYRPIFPTDSLPGCIVKVRAIWLADCLATSLSDWFINGRNCTIERLFAWLTDQLRTEVSDWLGSSLAARMTYSILKGLAIFVSFPSWNPNGSSVIVSLLQLSLMA